MNVYDCGLLRASAAGRRRTTWSPRRRVQPQQKKSCRTRPAVLDACWRAVQVAILGSRTACRPFWRHSLRPVRQPHPAPTHSLYHHHHPPTHHPLQTDHKCVLDSCRYLQQRGFEVTYLPVQKNGLIDLQQLEDAIRPETSLVRL